MRACAQMQYPEVVFEDDGSEGERSPKAAKAVELAVSSASSSPADDTDSINK